jgi:hypothetical protein
MKKLTFITAITLILAAATFWISWLLMPDPGTTDTPHILAIVKESRGQVLASVLIQIVSSCLYIVALFSLAQVTQRQSRLTLIGSILFGIGVLGLCADAFFHLLAYFMTDDSVTIQRDVVQVMDFMQTTGVVILIPILLPFFIGGLIISLGLARQGNVGRGPIWILASAFFTTIVGAIISKNIFPLDAKMFSMTVLGLFATGHVAIALQLTKRTSLSQTEETLELAESK